MTDNPLKTLSNDELVSFAEEMDKYTSLLQEVYYSHSDSSQGILDPYGVALLRAIYVCVLKLYMDKNIMTLREIAVEKGGYKLELSDYRTDMENFSAGVFDPVCLEEQLEDVDGYSDWFSEQVFGEIPISRDIYDLSKLDGIGDFIENELPVNGAYELYFGADEDEEGLEDETSEEVEETDEDEEYEEPDEPVDSEQPKAELPDFFRSFFQEVEDDYENYYSEIVSFTVCRSKKLGKAIELLKKKDYDKEKIENVPLLKGFANIIECLCEKNLFYLDSCNGDLVENEEWFGYTLTTGTCDNAQAITIYQRIPCVRGYAYLAQEIADRILDGRFQC